MVMGYKVMLEKRKERVLWNVQGQWQYIYDIDIDSNATELDLESLIAMMKLDL
jgi:uncharacterized membrane protein YecN with MAPEG domain